LIYELSTVQNAEHQLYEDYFNVLLELYAQDESIYEMDSVKRFILYEILDNAQGRLRSYVRNVLITIDTLEYSEPYILPEEGYKSLRIITKPTGKTVDKNIFKLYPNPAGDYVIIEYSLKELPVEGYVEFVDSKGLRVKKISVMDTHDYMIVTLESLNSGMYFCRFVINGDIIETQKLLILD